MQLTGCPFSGAYQTMMHNQVQTQQPPVHIILSLACGEQKKQNLIE
jgi:hypothetical protein